MLPMDAKPVEAYVEGVDISGYLDAKFLGLLSRRIPGIRAVSITFIHETEGKDAHGDPNLASVTLWYPKRPKPGEPIRSVSVDTRLVADLEGTLAAMEEFRGAPE